MRFLIDTVKKGKDLHHAYLIEGKRGIVLPVLLSFFEEHLKIKTSGNPDFLVKEFDTFSVSDSRALREAHIQKAFTGDRKVFVISANSITREAQNALLKTFEDTISGTHFFLIFPSKVRLLPTLLSRLEVYSYKENDGEDNKKLASDFLSSNPTERMKLLKGLIESKNKAQTVDFINAVEAKLKEKASSPISEKETFIFGEIIKCRKYLAGPSPSVKMILEYLSLVVPY